MKIKELTEGYNTRNKDYETNYKLVYDLSKQGKPREEIIKITGLDSKKVNEILRRIKNREDLDIQAKNIKNKERQDTEAREKRR